MAFDGGISSVATRNPDFNPDLAVCGAQVLYCSQTYRTLLPDAGVSEVATLPTPTPVGIRFEGLSQLSGRIAILNVGVCLKVGEMHDGTP